MQIEKRTMNWLPRPSLYDEATAAREKHRANARAGLETSPAMNSALIDTFNNSATGDAINLTLQIAAERIQAQANAKLKEAQDSLNKVA